MRVPKHLKIVRLEGKGQGLFAAEPIKKGQSILKLHGTITDDEHSSDYALQVGEGEFVDSPGTQVGDYLNHSCKPNVYWDMEDFYLKAIHDIKEGEELCFDYSTTEYDLVNSNNHFKCLCGSKNCVGEVKGFKHLTEDQRLGLKPWLAPFLRKKLKE